MLELERAGVPDEVTDLMVALSYPDRFKVSRLDGSAGGGPGSQPESWADWASDAYLWGYAPFAYSYWQFNDYWYSHDVIIIGDGNGGHPGGGGSPGGSGRVVNGRGYTRIEPVSVTHATREHSTSSDSTSSTTSSSSDSSGVSSQGYSSGSSSGGSDRTAQPRPPNR